MMMFTTKMCQLAAIVLDQDADNVTKELLKQGVLHFVKVTEVEEDAKSMISSVSPKVSQSKIQDTRKRIETFFNLINYSPVDIKELDIAKLNPVNLEESNGELDIVAAKLQKIRDRQKGIQKEIHKLEEIDRQLDLFSDLGTSLEERDKYSFLSIVTGKIESEKEDDMATAFQVLPSVQIKLSESSGYSNILLITMKRDSGRVEKILEKYEWEEVELPDDINGLGSDARSEIAEKLIALKEKQNEINNSAKDFVLEKKEYLDDMWSNLRMNELFYRIQSFYSKTSRTMLFSGWLPAAKKEILEESIRDITEGRCYLEWSDPKEIKKEKHKEVSVPVKMNNAQIPFSFRNACQKLCNT